MLRLMLLRHAKSSWAEPGQPDSERPLSPRGRRSATLMADAMVARDLQPDRILCSPARRTRETLAALLPVLTAETRIAITGELYEPPSGDYLTAIGRRCADAKRLLVIGHNPAIQMTALDLAAENDPLRAAIGEKFPTGALVVIDLTVSAWDGIATGSGRLIDFIRPRELELDAGFDSGDSED